MIKRFWFFETQFFLHNILIKYVKNWKKRNNKMRDKICKMTMEDKICN